MAAGIEIRELCHSFGKHRVLENVNLRIEEGEIFGLLGPSGAGKTTLIKLITGQLLPSAGNAAILGKNSKELTGKDYRQIGIMMDNFGLYERLNCCDNLKLFTKLNGLPKQRIEEVLEQVGLLEAKRTVAANLSKGMRSRLLLARAFLCNPQILFLDEPTSGLDPMTAEAIHRLIIKEKRKGTTIFLTTHNMAEAEKICDHIALLNEGEIVEYGNPGEICRRYNHQRRILVHLHSGADAELTQDKAGAGLLAHYIENEEIEAIHSTEPDLETVFMELTGRKLE